MSQIFVSYAHSDSDYAELLQIRLEKAGFTIWLDTMRLRAGEDWRNSIDDAIRSFLTLVAIITPDAVASNYVTYEWAFALGTGIRVIPLLLKSAELHPRLAVFAISRFY